MADETDEAQRHGSGGVVSTDGTILADGVNEILPVPAEEQHPSSRVAAQHAVERSQMCEAWRTWLRAAVRQQLRRGARVRGNQCRTQRAIRAWSERAKAARDEAARLALLSSKLRRQQLMRTPSGHIGLADGDADGSLPTRETRRLERRDGGDEAPRLDGCAGRATTFSR